MAKQVLVNESNLTNIANAIRSKIGNAHIGYETQTVPFSTKISKTSNAISHTEKSGGYGNNKSVYDEITIPGASSINVTISYQTESTQYDYVQICQGTKSQFDSSVPKYGGTTLTKKDLTFQGDSVTFYFKSDTSNDTFLGYYAEITGVGENNEPITGTEEIEVPVVIPNIFKPSEMADVIMGIGNGIEYMQPYTGDSKTGMYLSYYFSLAPNDTLVFTVDYSTYNQSYSPSYGYLDISIADIEDDEALINSLIYQRDSHGFSKALGIKNSLKTMWEIANNADYLINTQTINSYTKRDYQRTIEYINTKAEPIKGRIVLYNMQPNTYGIIYPPKISNVYITKKE